MDDIDQNMEDVSTFTLADVEGIGAVRLRKLNEAGIFRAEDLIIIGTNELKDKINMDYGVCSDIIDKARKSIDDNGIIAKTKLSARDLLKHRKKTIQHLTTDSEGLDRILGGGIQTGSITEVYGEFGCGKTQLAMVASITAQLPRNRTCLACGIEYIIPDKPAEPYKPDESATDEEKSDYKESSKEYKETLELYKDELKEKSVDNCTCGGKVMGGGLSEYGKPCGVVYIDTENSFRPERMLELIYEKELVPLKEQTPMEKKREAPREPLNDVAEELAMKYLDRVDLRKPDSSGQQVLIGREMKGLLGEKDSEHPVRMIIVDSIMSAFRLDFGGRGDLSNRQIILKEHIKELSRIALVFNCIVLFTNQIMMNPNAMMGDPVKPVGGTVLSHTAKQIVYLRKGTKSKVVAKLVDSPDSAKDEAVLQLTKKGLEDGE